MEFLVPDFGLPQTQLLQPLKEQNTGRKIFSLSPLPVALILIN